jgi:F420-dependent oxidoreductase-like protein
MKIGIFGGTVNSGTIDDVVSEAKQAERDGFASYWAPNIFGHDALTALAIVGREVPRIEIGTSVVPTYPRHPIAIAQQSHTVNAASKGRLCLGIGLSHKVVVEGMLGLSYDKPVRHLREYLSVLMPLARCEKSNFVGETYTTKGSLYGVGSSPFSVVVAALGPQLLRVTGALADGTYTWCTGPNTLKKLTVPTINEAAKIAGRKAPRVIAALPVCVTNDVAKAKEFAAKAFVIYGQLPSYRAMLDHEGAAGPEDIVIAGTAEQVKQRIADLGGVGVTDFAAVEFSSNPDEIAATRNALKSLL